MTDKTNSKRKRLYFTFHNQWVFSGCNWYDFSLIKLHVMNDVFLGAFEVEVAFLGLCFECQWVHDFGPRDALEQRAKAWIDRMRAKQ